MTTSGTGSSPVARALLSVTDKTGIVDLARGLSDLGVELLSTGGTRAHLLQAGLPVTDVAGYTGHPELFGGRVKTLHPKIHGGILYRRDEPSDVREAGEHGIAPIDLVCVNLYAFERAAAQQGAAIEEVVEQIDIGGPALLRAAAKNHAHVITVVDPADYPRVLEAVRSGAGLDLAARRALALKVYRHTSAYDRAISAWLERVTTTQPAPFPETLSIDVDRVLELRYGENPHQGGALYADRGGREIPASLARAKQIGGKALSYNNLLDADAALGLILDLGGTSAVYIKHNNPCGAASAPSLPEAIKRARAVDPVSAFGAVVALSQPVDLPAAEVLAETFLEVILAPSFFPDAIELLGKKKNLRLLDLGPLGDPGARGLELRRIRGGFLLQTADAGADARLEVQNAKVVTKRAPSEEELAALTFNWVVAKHVRSNAIVFGYADRVVAVGAGQMSRVDSVELCRLKGGDALRGTVVASDAFFPFRDGVDLLARAGATAIAQPGGSVRDQEVIEAADQHGLAMVLTGVRHFRH